MSEGGNQKGYVLGENILGGWLGSLSEVGIVYLVISFFENLNKIPKYLWIYNFLSWFLSECDSTCYWSFFTCTIASVVDKYSQSCFVRNMV